MAGRPRVAGRSRGAIAAMVLLWYGCATQSDRRPDPCAPSRHRINDGAAVPGSVLLLGRPLHEESAPYLPGDVFKAGGGGPLPSASGTGPCSR